MKRTIFLLLSICLMLSACGATENTQPDTNNTLTWKDLYEKGVSEKAAGNDDSALTAFNKSITLIPEKDALEGYMVYQAIADIHINRYEFQKAYDILSEGEEKTNSYYNDSIIFNKANLIHDSDNNVYGRSHFENDKLVWYHQFSFNKEKQLTSVTYYNMKTGASDEIEISYNDSGKPLQGYAYYSDDGRIELLSMEYDENNRLIKSSEYSPSDNSLLGYTTYEYDENNFISKETHYSRNAELDWNYQRSYDIDAMHMTYTISKSNKTIATGEADFDKDGNLSNQKSTGYSSIISYDVDYLGNKERIEYTYSQESLCRTVCFLTN